MQPPNSILIIRPSAMGDIVMASPLLAALRQKYPEARITWLVEPGLADLLRHNPDLNEVILWPKGEWVRLWKERRYFELLRRIREFRAELRTRNFDLAIDLVGLAKSRFLLWLAGAATSIGFDSQEPGTLLLGRKVVKTKDDPAMSSEYRQMALALELDPGLFHPRIALSANDLASADELRTTRGISKRYAIFAPFTTRPQKHWFDERWSALAAVVQTRFGLEIVVLGGPADFEHGQAICAAAAVTMHNLSGRSSLGQSAALIQGAALLIGVDTGLTHMGTAFDRPTVALFGATCPYLTTPNSLTKVLYQPMRCSPCRRSPSCDQRFDCMAALTVEQVLATCLELLERAAIS